MVAIGVSKLDQVQGVGPMDFDEFNNAVDADGIFQGFG
jgi:hypothetical protein